MKDTKIQDEKLVFDTIKRLIAERGISPSVEEIRIAAGISFGRAFQVVERLENKNKIKRTAGVNRSVYRSIQIVKRARKNKNKAA